MNIQTLKLDTHFLCGSTSATYTDADMIRNYNVAYNDVARLAWENDGTWRYDDSNNTDLPVAYRTVANASGTYLLPSTALRVEQVEVKDGNGDWQKLLPVSDHDLTISPEEYLGTPGMPLRYQLDGSQIRLFPAPGTGSVTMTSGMAVRLSRDVTQIPVTATSYTPGFPQSFHRILSYAAAMDFVQDPEQRKYLSAQKARLEQGLMRFYQGRAPEVKTRIKPATQKRWRSYT